MLVGKSAKDVDRRSQKIGTRTYGSEPFQIDVDNFGITIKLRETSIDGNPEGRVAAW